MCIRDREREEIGCLYNRDKEAAYEKGFQIGTSKLYNIYKKIKTLFFDKDQKIVIFCWRGGMRSKSIVVNLNMMGINVYQLKGGYKSYRKYILDQLNCINNRNNYKYYVLHGNTGVGKTNLLKELERIGEPVLDLEGMANNRGSIFGGLGLGKPMNQKMFDALLFEKFRNNRKDYFFIEAESKRIGNIILPDFLVSSIENGFHILVNADINERIKNIMDEYLPISNKTKTEIIELMIHNKFIEKRKGLKWIESLITYLKENNYREFIKKLLEEYYDPLYAFSEKKYEPYEYIIENDNLNLSLLKLKSIVTNQS